MPLAFAAALACLALWAGWAFLWAIPSGWVHVPLAAAAVLVAKGIVDRDR